MLKSYEALYNNGQLQWIGEAPPPEDARVIVTITERSPAGIKAAAPNGHRFVALGKQLAATGVAGKFGDPIAWQRERREERIVQGPETD